MKRLIRLSICVALQLSIFQNYAGEPSLQSDSTRLNQFVLTCVDPANYQGDLCKQRLQFLMKKNDLSIDSIQQSLKTSPYFDHEKLWRIALASGSKTVSVEFAKYYFSPPQPKEEISRREFCASGAASAELTEALLPYLESAADEQFNSDHFRRALEIVAKCPSPNSIPVLVRGAKSPTDSYRRQFFIEALGRIQSPAALCELEKLWRDAPGEHTTLCAIVSAISTYGDAGADVFERVGDASYATWGLQAIATPKAVILAEKLCKSDNINDRADVIRVKIAAGEPYRTSALIEALADGAPAFLSESALECLCQTVQVPTPEQFALVRRAALFESKDISGKAINALENWKYCAQSKNVLWSEPVDGLSIGVRPAEYKDIEIQDDVSAAVSCLVFFKNTTTKSLLLDCTENTWRLEPGGSFESASNAIITSKYAGEFAPDIGYPVCHTLSVKPVGFDNRQPLKFRLRLKITADDYPDLPGGTGTIVSPEMSVAVPPPVDTKNLAHWRTMLDDLSQTGILRPGMQLGWSASGTFLTSFRISNSCVEANGVWNALPDDMKHLSEDEIKSIARFLRSDDNFANSISYYNGGMGKYPPHASLWLESETRRAKWEQYSFKQPFAQGLHKIERALFLPRLHEARKRMGVKESLREDENDGEEN